MSRPVLCAVDISNGDQDKNVLKQAARLAALDDAQLDVITVVPDFGMSVVSTYFNETHQQEAVNHARDLLNSFCIETLGEETNAKVRHLVVVGKAYEEILHVAETDGAGLIVIGAHKLNLRDYLLGPNAARVVRHSDCSVLVVR